MDDWDDNDRFGGDEAEGEDGGSRVETRKVFSVFVIDARQSMLVDVKDTPGKSQLSDVLGAVAKYMRDKAVTGDGTRVAVMLAGVDAAQGTLAPTFRNRIVLLHELQAPAIDIIQTLQAYASNIHSLVGPLITPGAPTSNSAWDEAITAAQTAFLNAKAKNTDERRISFFTNDDSPPDAAAARSKGRDVSQDAIELQVYPMHNPTTHPFDPHQFWTDFVKKDAGAARAEGAEDDDVEDVPGAATIEVSDSMAKLVNTLRKREARKRVVRRLLMTLAPGVHISVGVYHNLQTARKPTPKIATFKDGQLVAVKPMAQYLDSYGGEVGASDILKAIPVRGSAIPAKFSTKEAKQMYRVQGGGEGAGAGAGAGAVYPSELGLSKTAEPTSGSALAGAGAGAGAGTGVTAPEYQQGMRILGFQPRRLLRDTDNVKPAQLIYPQDKDVQGSRAAFHALWQRLLEREMVAIASYVASDGEPPVMWALLPERERVDATGTQTWPPCLYAITLPYADDFRRIPAGLPATYAKPSPSLLDAASSLVDGYTVKEDEEPWDLREQAIMNPSLQRFYRGLEAAALGMIYSVQESELSDTTRYPEYSALANRDESDELHAYLQSVQGATGFDGAGAGAGRAAPKAGTKRKAEGPADGGAEEIDEVDQISRGTLGKLTVDALKGVCRKRKLAVSGTKDVLVARIEQDVNKKGK